LASDDWADQVRKEQQLASEFGVRGVPFFAIGQYGVSGAQPSNVLLQAIERAAKEAPDIEPSAFQAAARPEPEAAELCTPERCE
jgi:predicted DsbA family dithiol-disulfide isomerase